MSLRDNFQKLIDKKQQEIDNLELQLREANAYIQALQDSMKLLPREGNNTAEMGYNLRPDSTLAKARDIIRATGKPMPIGDILKAIGASPDKKNRVSLAGTLSSYTKKGRIFTKTAPNTFGLLEFGASQAIAGEDDLPEDFGSMTQLRA